MDLDAPWLRELAASYLPQLRDLSIAYALAFVLGWNRERRGRSAGLRTFPLVAVASCGFVQAAETMAADSPEAMARVVEGLITGIGFIGGGAILKAGRQVHGTATAASIWATGAIGAAVGLGSYQVAVTVCLFAAITLYMLTPLKADRADGERADLAAEDRERE
ncbi:MAG TPA: MgtC/SapB family protein [Falsiroseomonas sp.]|nr:MgtC/SapB family protein [Falsiroseomonas sp.]